MKPVLISLTLSALTSTWADDYDYDLDQWRCGAPLVHEWRAANPLTFLSNEHGSVGLKESLTKISQVNMNRIIANAGNFSYKERQLISLIKDFYHAPVVHRTKPETAKSMITGSGELASPTKRKATAYTPVIEEELFSGHDCIYTSIGIPYGTERYGSTIVRLREGLSFGWATVRSGFKWIQYDLGLDPNGRADSAMRLQFLEQVITHEHWDEALAYMIIENVRAGTTFLSQGKPYNNRTMLTHLLSQRTRNLFWDKVQKYRLAYMEGKHLENITMEGIDWIGFDGDDEPFVKKWTIAPSKLLPVIKFYNNTKVVIIA